VNGNWTRSYEYDEPNPHPSNNRLTSTTVGAVKEPYAYDAQGNMAQMPHLALMEWDFQDQLHVTQRQVGNTGPGERTYHVYDAGGHGVRKVTESVSGSKTKERTYLASFELYREYSGGAITLERETLHVIDGARRVALVETKTTDSAPLANAVPNTLTR